MKTRLTPPVADNPCHVNNLCTLALLKAQGFRGPDASPTISLAEYGLAWRKLDDEILFVYAHPSLHGRFDRCTMRNDLDVKREFDWVEWSELFSYLVTDKAWFELPLEQQICDLFNYHGAEEIFGTSNWEGFEIAGLEL